MNDVVLPTLYGISLFSGIGGLDLGVEHILPQSKTICYVEGEIFNAKILFQKMQKGELSHAPIYSDVRTFPSVAHNFSEKVDFITAGFPCQPFSLAGRLKGTNDKRWLWDSILQTIKQTRPSFLFLENVSNLLNEWEAFDEISKSLSEIGFNLEWANVRASDVGANHKRNRLFIFAYRPGKLSNLILTNPHSKRRDKNVKKLRWRQLDTLWEGITITNPTHDGKSIMCLGNEEGRLFQQPKSNFEPSWWGGKPPFSPICGVDDGISYGMDRIRSLGNAVVPFQASQAYYHLI
jgi:DNA (cytosine-5)-methyltransferase 1